MRSSRLRMHPMTDASQKLVDGDGKDRVAELEMRKRSRRSFLLAGISAAAGITAFNWLRTRPDDGAVSWPLRRVLEFNERLSRTRFSNAHLAPNFPMELAETPRENGGVGLNEEMDLCSWSLKVINAPGQKPDVHYASEDAMAQSRRTFLKAAGMAGAALVSG